MADVSKEIKTAMDAGKILIGSKKVAKAAKSGNLAAIYYATNCPGGRKGDITHYSEVSGLQVNEFTGNSTRLGEVCGKPFNVLMVGIKK